MIICEQCEHYYVCTDKQANNECLGKCPNFKKEQKGDLISREALKEKINEKQVVGRFNTVLLIDQAPTVEPLERIGAICEENCGYRPQSKWIPVSERLPEKFQECLVVDAEGEYGIGYYREDAKAWDSPNWGWLERADRVDNREAFAQPCGIHKVIAWQPLPEPYEKGGAE